MNDQTEYLQLRNFEKALNADVLKKAQARGTDVPWIKSYIGQMYDPEYMDLSLSERGLLADLRLLAARRGNKIPNDETTLKRLMGYSKGSRLGLKLAHLAALRFLEPYSPATNQAANQLFPSHIGLYDGENDSPLDVDVDVEKDLGSRPKANSGGAPNGTSPTTEGVSEKVKAWIRTIGVLYPDDQVVAEELRQAFRLEDTDQAVELWRELRAGLGTGAA